MWYNPIMVWMLYSPLQGVLSGNMMVLNYTGRKSGKEYQLPVSYKRIDNTLLTGSYKRRIWWRNLRGGVPVTIRLQGKDVTGQAEVIEDEQGVMNGIKAYIGGDPRIARMFKLTLGTDGQPETDSLRQVARDQVIVRTILK
jgi:predicted TIM-barrel fold metal-dependent hydrolase